MKMKQLSKKIQHTTKLLFVSIGTALTAMDNQLTDQLLEANSDSRLCAAPKVMLMKHIDQENPMQQNEHSSSRFAPAFSETTIQLNTKISKELSDQLANVQQLVRSTFNEELADNTLADFKTQFDVMCYVKIRLDVLQSLGIKHGQKVLLNKQRNLVSFAMTGSLYSDNVKELQGYLTNRLEAERSALKEANQLNSLYTTIRIFLNIFKYVFGHATMADEIGNNPTTIHAPLDDVLDDIQKSAEDVKCYPIVKVLEYLRNKMYLLLDTLPEHLRIDGKKEKNNDCEDCQNLKIESDSEIKAEIPPTKVSIIVDKIKEKTHKDDKVVTLFSILNIHEIQLFLEKRDQYLNTLKEKPSGKRKHNALADAFYGKDFKSLMQQMIDQSLIYKYFQELADMMRLNHYLELQRALYKFQNLIKSDCVGISLA